MKRAAVLSLLAPERLSASVPAAFFLHFDDRFHRGRAAVDRHLEYFRATGMDFVKIQYENPLPPQPIHRPGDWGRIRPPAPEFFAEPLAVVKGIVKEVKRDALVVTTLYSPFMLAGQLAGDVVRDGHLREDPAAVAKGIAIIAESLVGFVRECVAAGVDGFYASTQGGEAGRFADPAVFADHVKPTDLEVWRECLRGTSFNILHVCDYHLPYDDLGPFLDYPGDVVSCPLTLAGQQLSPRLAAALFGRPVLGGMDRHGVIARGSEEQIRSAVATVLADAPDRFILGADCTLPPDTPWPNIRAAVEAAHRASSASQPR